MTPGGKPGLVENLLPTDSRADLRPALPPPPSVFIAVAKSW
jgi:hypothetical protein